MNKEIMTKKEIVEAGGIIGLKYQGKEFPRYALLKDGSLYFKMLNREYSKQTLATDGDCFMYRLFSFIDDKKHVEQTSVGAAKLMLENFTNIDASVVAIEYKDGDSSNVSLSNLKYTLSLSMLYSITAINIMKIFNYKFRCSDLIEFNDLSINMIKNVNTRIKIANEILERFDPEELKLALVALNSTNFCKLVNIKDAKYAIYILRRYLNISLLIVDYSCLMNITIKEFIDICKIAKTFSIYNIVEAKQKLEQFKPTLSQSEVVKLLILIYQRLLYLNLDKIINILESYDCNNIHYTIYQLQQSGIVSALICYLFKIDKQFFYSNDYKIACKKYQKGDVHE